MGWPEPATDRQNKMQPRLEVLFTPTEFGALIRRDLSGTVCVVFDVLRATSSMVTALANGAEAISPVAEISEALSMRARHPEILLAGERDGLRIEASLTGSIEFDLGNSPREFTPERVGGKRLAMTTTNGTRALRACAGARTTLICSFLNLSATADYLKAKNPQALLLVCGGTFEGTAYEDVLGAGGLCQLLWDSYGEGWVDDSAEICRRLYVSEEKDLAAALAHSRNGKRLLQRHELSADVPFCLQRDKFNLVAIMDKDGWVRKKH
jgi:2-phosphosulfolactate phosphatase